MDIRSQKQILKAETLVKQGDLRHLEQKLGAHSPPNQRQFEMPIENMTNDFQSVKTFLVCLQYPLAHPRA